MDRTPLFVLCHSPCIFLKRSPACTRFCTHRQCSHSKWWFHHLDRDHTRMHQCCFHTSLWGSPDRCRQWIRFQQSTCPLHSCLCRLTVPWCCRTCLPRTLGIRLMLRKVKICRPHSPCRQRNLATTCTCQPRTEGRRPCRLRAHESRPRIGLARSCHPCTRVQGCKSWSAVWNRPHSGWSSCRGELVPRSGCPTHKMCQAHR